MKSHIKGSATTAPQSTAQDIKLAREMPEIVVRTGERIDAELRPKTLS